MHRRPNTDPDDVTRRSTCHVGKNLTSEGYVSETWLKLAMHFCVHNEGLHNELRPSDIRDRSAKRPSSSDSYIEAPFDLLGCNSIIHKTRRRLMVRTTMRERLSTHALTLNAINGRLE